MIKDNILKLVTLALGILSKNWAVYIMIYILCEHGLLVGVFKEFHYIFLINFYQCSASLCIHTGTVSTK
jgi:hypothetical protein